MFDIKLAEHLAELSKIKFSEKELQKISSEMDEIIGLLDTVSDFEITENPVVNTAQKLENIREDLPTPTQPRKYVLKNASKKDKKAFAVPKVV